MPTSKSKVGAIVLGAAAGVLAVVILLVVPVAGVRKELNLLVVDWQELILYSASFIAGTIGGARVAYRQMRSDFAENAVDAGSAVNEKAVDAGSATGQTSSANENAVDAGSAARRSSLVNEDATAGDSGAEVSISEVLNFSPCDDELPLLTEPVIEESLAGGPKKPKKRLWNETRRARTTALSVFLYLVLFVMCAVLCQRLGIGNIVSDPISAEIIRTVGLGVAVVGLYLMVRGLFKSDGKVFGIDDQFARAGHAPHVPPSRFGFLKQHPVCAGWLFALTGLPLVFQAWFPLLAIPGLFIGMNWLFPDKQSAL